MECEPPKLSCFFFHRICVLQTRGTIINCLFLLLGQVSGFANTGWSRHEQTPSQSMSFVPERTVVLAYHKPPGIITTHDDQLGRPNVYDDIMSMRGYKDIPPAMNPHLLPDFETVTKIRSKLHAIGRLDADTSGLLLLTNDGGLVHHVTNKNARTVQLNNQGPVSKTYEALVMGRHGIEDAQLDNGDSISSAVLKKLSTEGVDLGKAHGGKTLPVQNLAVLAHPSRSSTLLSLTLVEGKNRQIRRMFHALGSGVMNLKRTKIGEYLTLDNLEEGEWRILSEGEVSRALNWEPRDLKIANTVKIPSRNFSPGQSVKQRRRRK